MINVPVAIVTVLTSLVGAVMIWADLYDGRTRLWVGNHQRNVTRAAQPFLFWIAIAGWTALFSGLLIGGTIVALFKR